MLNVRISAIKLKYITSKIYLHHQVNKYKFMKSKIIISTK